MSDQGTHYLQRNLHEHNDKDDFRTPRYLFDFIQDTFGAIDYDGACEDGVNNLAPALRLEERWPDGATVYSNPPYDKSSIRRWYEKGQSLARRDGLHIMLLPDKMCQVFFSDMIPNFSEIIVLGGRVNFTGPYSTKGGASMNGSIITVQSSRIGQTGVTGVLLRCLKERYK